MSAGLVIKAGGLFLATNVDDLLMLALFFGRAPSPAGALRVVLGQYLGFVAILAVAVSGAFGAGLLPDRLVGYLGLVPLLLGLRAGWAVWREQLAAGPERFARHAPPLGAAAPGVGTVSVVTLANGGDNIGVYVPVFAVAGPGSLLVYVPVFLALVALWCALARHLATRPVVAAVLSRWGHVVLPVVLICVGLTVLVEGGVFRVP